MDTTTKISVAEMRAEVAGEHRRRQRVYAKWVQEGTLSQADADRRNARFQAVIDLLDREGTR